MSTDWEKVADGAMEKTEKELSAGIERLITGNLAKLFPNPADAEKVRELCLQVRVKSSYNERIAVFKALSASLGSTLGAAVKKAMFPLILMMLVLTGQVRAQVEPVTPPVKTSSLFDFGDFFKNVRGGYTMNQHQQLSTVFYTPWKVFHTKEKLPLASINLGYDGLQKRPLVAIGMRADNLDSLLWNGKWGKEHVTTAKLPSLEFGPFVSVWPVKTDTGYKLDVSYGAALAIGFSIGSN